MTLPIAIQHDQTYYDPELWERLGPMVLRHFNEKMLQMARVRRDDGSYREEFGYLRGVEWVLEQARELQRKSQGVEG